LWYIPLSLHFTTKASLRWGQLHRALELIEIESNGLKTDKIQLDLFDNALDSLNESLEKYKQGSKGDTRAYKFCIQHLSHFLELIFKYYVYQCHPLLIYKNPFAKNIKEDAFTITLTDAINFLKNEGRNLPEEFEKDLNWLKNLRNKIEHHRFSMSLDEVKETIGRLINALVKFDELYDNLGIIEYIPEKHYFLFFELAYSYEERLKKAQDIANTYSYHPKRNPEQFTVMCEECHHETMTPNEESATGYRCSFCGCEDSDNIMVQCTYCGSHSPKWQMSGWNEDEESYYICIGCMGH